MNRLVRVADRDRSSTAWALVRTTLGELTGLAPSRLRFDRTCSLCGDAHHGKPRLLDAPVEFSVAHSADRVVVAVSEAAPVGVDVEPIDVPLADVADSFLHPHELGVPPADLVRLWVRKEAVVKATGQGLIRPLREISVLSAPAGMLLVNLPDEGGYVAAVAAVTNHSLTVTVE